MSQMVTEFTAWEVQQPLRFGLADGRPVRLPDSEQAPSRLDRVRVVAERVLRSEAGALVWLGTAHAGLGDLQPEAVATASEEGCQSVLRLLVVISRREGDEH